VISPELPYIAMNTTRTTTPASAKAAQFSRLLEYLKQDPQNLNLLHDAAVAAYEANEYEACAQLLQSFEALQPLTPDLINLRGLAAMSEGNFAKALENFESLNPSDPVARYNAAYACAMLGQHEQSLVWLDDATLRAFPEAVTLKVRALHHLARVDEAIELGRAHVHGSTIDPALPGALATALFDANAIDDARRLASLHPESPDSLTVLGLLDLKDGANNEALARFDRALRLRPDAARAKLGMGLGLLAVQRFDEAALTLDEAAAALRTHAGSWVAAGWAHLFQHNLVPARERFERAGEIDRGFAEAHGGLAVVSYRQQHLDDARRHATTALRLDKNCLSAAYAMSLLAASAGDDEQSKAIITHALETPVAIDGPTISQLLVSRAPRKT
jgi:tetratricopeptide (TPR) repeat protein